VSPIKIMWHSVAPWAPTGYGQQTALFAPRIKALGHDLAISCFYGVQGAALMWQGIKCLPSYSASYGTDVIVPHAMSHFGAADAKTVREAATRGLIITLCDTWVLDAPLLPDMNVAAWAPMDHETMPPIVHDWLENSGAIPIAMSRFGERQLRDNGFNPLYVPHGVDTAVFHPGDKDQARQAVGLPKDAFVVALVAANVGKDGARKAFSEQIRAFGELRRRHSDAMLVLHTDIDSPVGVKLRDLLADLPRGSYIYSDQYAYRTGVPAGAVADIYRAADVFTNTSWGEGFGICIIESQACGTPVVVTDTTAMPELVGAGWKVPGEPLWHDGQRAWARRPLIGGIADAYEQAYDQARDDNMRALAWAHAQAYDADLITAEYWVPALKAIEASIQRRREDLLRIADPDELTPQFRTSDGFTWIERGSRTDDWIGHSDHESGLAEIMDRVMPDGGVFLDVGAHIGRWSLRMARRASQVFAVEPNPATVDSLRQHIAINLVDNVTILEMAAWDQPATLELDDPNNRLAGGSTRTVPLSEHTSDEINPVIVVGAGRLDAEPALAELKQLDLIKMDVEGADLHALRGLSGLLAKHHPAILLECHDAYGYYSRDELHATLDKLGYTYEVVKSNLTTWSPNGPVPVAVAADYLLCLPAPTTEAGIVAHDAVFKHGAAQREEELAEVLELIHGHLPAARKVIVEIGCDRGGTLYAWTRTGADVLGITLPDNGFATGGSGEALITHGALVHRGDSHAPASLAWLTGALGDRAVDVLVLDGDHTTDGLRADFDMYSPLVAPGGLILVHDIASKGDTRAEVHKVWPITRDGWATGEILSKIRRPFGWGVVHVPEQT